ncbi:hypothetical protein KUTeg_013879 [Tegillarca granosa]|uniref:Uncharacterized protein n=1 Tax=Tegillarca granosa TaxID=220873 RepID=A0ABQ9EV02_TEGGR|nr:hypothetical protein KUTeg_013879 [Tegillarca granosa]
MNEHTAQRCMSGNKQSAVTPVQVDILELEHLHHFLRNFISLINNYEITDML